MAEHHLAGDLAAGIMAPTGLDVVEGIHAVDDRPNLMLLHQAAKILQVTTAARRDQLKPRLADEHGPEVQAASIGRKSAQERDLAARGCCLGRVRQRTGATNLDDSVKA